MREDYFIRPQPRPRPFDVHLIPIFVPTLSLLFVVFASLPSLPGIAR